MSSPEKKHRKELGLFRPWTRLNVFTGEKTQKRTWLVSALGAPECLHRRKSTEKNLACFGLGHA
ncbi:MAG: hypothetical protein RSA12_04480, partial [Clostridia bacterium]